MRVAAETHFGMERLTDAPPNEARSGERVEDASYPSCIVGLPGISITTSTYDALVHSGRVRRRRLPQALCILL